MRHTALVLIVLVTGCADKGAPVEPPLGEGDGKADIADRVPVLGALAFGGEVRGELTEDLEFHGYTLDVRDGARVTLDITQLGSSRGLDTALFVYGPAAPTGGYGTEAIAHDDDSGWGQLSRLRDLALAAGGRYLVVVGSFDGRGRGRYRLTATCLTGECAPLPAGDCPALVAADIRACVEDVLADPEDAPPGGALEAVALCADPEPVADAFDATCAAPAPPAFCAGSYEEFARAVLPGCVIELEGEVYDRTCALGEVFADLWRASWSHVVRRRVITSIAGLGTLERQQIVLAVQASSHTDVTTAEEALSRVDEQEINFVEVWDASGRRSFTALEYGAGDNSYGRVFVRGTTSQAARIGDGDLYECAVMHGPEARPCRTADDCAAGLSCVGVAQESGRGQCVDRAADDHPAETDACTAAAGCPLDSGLVCAGLTRDPEGLCLPAWMRRSFETPAGELPIPDGDPAGAASTLIADGLATVDMDVEVEATLLHPDPRQLRVTLENPAGAEVVIHDGEDAGFGGELHLEGPVLGFSGDEEVNGVWTLRVTDRTGGAAGALLGWRLTVGSRWD